MLDIKLRNPFHTKILAATTTNEKSRYECSCVLFLENGVAVATNGRLLAVSLNHHDPISMPLMIEMAGVSIIDLNDTEENPELEMTKTIKVCMDAERGLARIGERACTVYRDINFPDWNKLIPKTWDVYKTEDLTRFAHSSWMKPISMIADRCLNTIWLTNKSSNFNGGMLLHEIEDLIVVGMPLPDPFKFKEEPDRFKCLRESKSMQAFQKLREMYPVEVNNDKDSSS